jgi:hypothetical protein
MPWIEGLVVLLPESAGGRSGAVIPRDGSYRPLARIAGVDQLLRVRFIEGPPAVAPGDFAQVLLELETDAGDVAPGSELELIENGTDCVGLVTVGRFVSSTVPTI